MVLNLSMHSSFGSLFPSFSSVQNELFKVPYRKWFFAFQREGGIGGDRREFRCLGIVRCIERQRRSVI